MLPAIRPVPGRSGPDETGETVGSLHPGPARHAKHPNRRNSNAIAQIANATVTALDDGFAFVMVQGTPMPRSGTVLSCYHKNMRKSIFYCRTATTRPIPTG